MDKIRILYSGETTGAASGFGTYGYNILSRLVKNPKFEIAEFASFGSINDGKYSNAKWKYYPNAVDDGHPEKEQYEQNPQFKYGTWRYERVLLDFKPDIVFTIRDPWMMEHEHKSPFRPYYHLAIMPTVDSAPQQHSWIEMFSTADAVFTYSDWAIPVLQKQSNGRIKPICSPYPGIEECFYPSTDRALSKQKLGLPPDSIIIGSVMRNQKRKLLEDLFKSFSIYLDKYGDTDVGKKTYLLIHTSYPDFAGWNLPKILKDYGISNKVYFTYVCKGTGQVFVKKFSGVCAYSPATNAMSAGFPSVGMGVTRETLADIYRTMDMYIQYAICEGLGMPQVEAAGCGVPLASVDYSAMADVVSKTHGIPLKTDRMFYEWETNAFRAYPDNNYTADAIFKFFSQDQKYRDDKSHQSRAAAEEFFSWDRSAKIWSDHFESVVLTGKQGKWDSPIALTDFNIPPYQEYPHMNNVQYVEWLCGVVAKDPELFTSFIGLSTIEQLNDGITSTFKGGHRITREAAYNMFKTLGTNRVVCEQARVNPAHLPEVDFIQFAHLFEKGLK
jgi:glycosyltransferase involved in cell wall biosynthesis